MNDILKHKFSDSEIIDVVFCADGADLELSLIRGLDVSISKKDVIAMAKHFKLLPILAESDEKKLYDFGAINTEIDESYTEHSYGRQ